MLASLAELCWCLAAILIHISMMTNDIGEFFHVVTYVPSFVKNMLKSFAIFLNGSFFFLLLGCKDFLNTFR